MTMIPQQPPSQPERDVIIEGHDYDGILEYDNPMPGWWLGIFYLTIVWSLFYVVGISLGYINSYEDDLNVESQRLFAIQHAAKADAPDVTPEYLAALLGNEEVLARGSDAYTATCAACHGQVGEGMIGPNLTDDHWLHGGSLTDMYDVVYDGVLDKGMPAWGNILSHDDSVAVVIYIDSLKGTDPPGAKAPEGTPYTAE